MQRRKGHSPVVTRVHLLHCLPRHPCLLRRRSELLAGRHGLLDGVGRVDSCVVQSLYDAGRGELAGIAVDKGRGAGRAREGGEERVGELHLVGQSVMEIGFDWGHKIFSEKNEIRNRRAKSYGGRVPVQVLRCDRGRRANQMSDGKKDRGRCIFAGRKIAYYFRAPEPFINQSNAITDGQFLT